MRILLVQNALYVPTHGGANKATRCVIEGLAARGHVCRAVARAHSAQGPTTTGRLLEALSSRHIEPARTTPEAVIFEHRGVEVHAVTAANPRTYLIKQLAEFEPDWALVASEDPGQVLLEASLPRAVYFAQTTLLLPFGPGCFLPLPRGAEIIRRAAGVITISEYLREYMHRWGGLDSVVMRPPIFGGGPTVPVPRDGLGLVTMINPCAVKGISIFLSLARRFPAVPFAAVTAWGTTQDDLRALRACPNVRLLEPADDLADVFARTSVLLVPSLWAEAFGYVVIEAMLQGVPVLASNVGGLPEAKLGVDYVLPVRPIERYAGAMDDRNTPRPVVEEQDCDPWADALGELLSNRDLYARLSRQSQAAAVAAVAATSIGPFETYLQTLGWAGALTPQSRP